MNKDLFWNIIDTVNQTFSDRDQESRRCLVVEKLVKLPLLERVKKVLIPIQMGKAEAQPFFCPTRDEVDAYRTRKGFIG